MMARFQEASFAQKVVMVFIALIVALFVLRIVLGILKVVVPLLILAVIIVGLLWLFDKLRAK